MSHDEMVFVIVWILNLVAAVLYYFWGAGILALPGRRLNHERYEKNSGRVCPALLIRCAVMILCPVVGALFFLLGHLIYRTVFRQKVDLADVIFSKECVRTHLRADEERERNMVPLEEALAVSDRKNLRMLMLNVIRGDLQDSLESVMLALNSEDSETSHYAASVLRDELNNFRTNVGRLHQEIQEETEEETEGEELLLDYMNGILKQNVFTDIELKRFVGISEETARSLYKKNPGRMTPQRYEGICLQLLGQNQFEKAEIWCTRLKEQYPQQLAAYTCSLKLYFKMNNKERFFAVMEELKQSDVVIDSETLEIIRIFSQT